MAAHVRRLTSRPDGKWNYACSCGGIVKVLKFKASAQQVHVSHVRLVTGITRLAR